MFPAHLARCVSNHRRPSDETRDCLDLLSKNRVVTCSISKVNGEAEVNRSVRDRVWIFSFVFLAALFASAQQVGVGTLDAEALKKAVPATYFFRGQSAPVQLRNSAGFRTADGKVALAGLVDTGGYASDIAQKYQGFLIAEEKLTIEGSDLPSGAYGFGFEKDGNFVVMDVGAHDVLSVPFHTDQNLPRAVPLKIVADQGSYRLYAGRKWVSLKLQ